MYLARNFYNDKRDVFQQPVLSSDFGIYRVSDLDAVYHVREVGDCCKCFRMPYDQADDTFVASVLLHDNL